MDMPVLAEGQALDAAQQALKARQLGSTIWADMDAHDVAPTPRAYELWFNYRAGFNRDLTERMTSLMGAREELTPALMDLLHRQYVAGSDLESELVREGVEGIQSAAESIVEQVQGNQADMKAYGDTLEHWAEHLSDSPSIGGLVKAVAALTAETTRAAERNRQLEHDLSASAARVNKLRRSLADVKQEATTDALTGIANRKAFDIRLKRALSQARGDPAVPLSLLLLDVDHFKRFNDNFGHRCGDLVLRLVARLLTDSMKGRDTVARYGGEEFAVLLSGADLPAARSVAQQICNALSSKRLSMKGAEQTMGNVTISIGVSQYRHGETGAALVERADSALYKSKEQGRNRVSTELDLQEAVAQGVVWSAS